MISLRVERAGPPNPSRHGHHSTSRIALTDDAFQDPDRLFVPDPRGPWSAVLIRGKAELLVTTPQVVSERLYVRVLVSQLLEHLNGLLLDLLRLLQPGVWV